MTDLVVVYDACVLYPAALRDFLMQLALADIYQAKWTNDIHEEWIRNVLKQRVDILRAQLDSVKEMMNECASDALIFDYESLIDSLVLPDKNDRHVLAAAIRANVSVIVTYNLKDFPKKIRNQYGIEAQYPDEFILHLFDLSSETVCLAIHQWNQT